MYKNIKNLEEIKQRNLELQKEKERLEEIKKKRNSFSENLEKSYNIVNL